MAKVITHNFTYNFTSRGVSKEHSAPSQVCSHNPLQKKKKLAVA